METFEEFCARMEKVEKTDEYVIGSAHYGNSRAIFYFDGYYCCMESYNYRRLPARALQRPATPAEMLWVISAEPYDIWICGEWVKGKKACTQLAKQYNGQARPDEYHEDDEDAWYLVFDGDNGFEKLMRLLYDHKTGKLPPETFPWRNERLQQEVINGTLSRT